MACDRAREPSAVDPPAPRDARAADCVRPRRRARGVRAHGLPRPRGPLGRRRPVYAERGARGGFALLDGYRTSLTGLSGDEAGALALAGLPAAAELGLGALLADAELKLRAALPAEVRAHVARVRERVHVDAPAWFTEQEPVPHLAAVAEAVFAERCVTVRYRRWSGEVTRTLGPLGLVVKSGTWYLVAGADGAVLTYRVSRILALVPEAAAVARPDAFDLAARWTENARGADGAIWQRYQGLLGDWSDWVSLGGVLATGPAAVASDDRAVDVYAVAPNGALYRRTWENAWVPGPSRAVPTSSTSGSSPECWPTRPSEA